MTSPTKTMPLSEAAYMLRMALGPLRNWTNFLSDNIRDRQSIHGLTLIPCARQSDGKAFRPVYAVADVLAFIRDVLAADSTAGKAPLKTATLDIDRRRPWRLNKFDQNGKPRLRKIDAHSRNVRITTHH